MSFTLILLAIFIGLPSVKFEEILIYILQKDEAEVELLRELGDKWSC